MTVPTKERLYAIYEAFVAGRLDLLEDAFDEDVDFLSHAPTEVFPYLGRRRGRAEVLRALARLHEDLDILSFLPISTVIDGDDAAVNLVIRIRQQSSGRIANFLAAHFVRFHDGRIAQYCAIVDSLDAVQQMLATRFDLTDRS